MGEGEVCSTNLLMRGDVHPKARDGMGHLTPVSDVGWTLPSSHRASLPEAIPVIRRLSELSPPPSTTCGAFRAFPAPRDLRSFWPRRIWG